MGPTRRGTEHASSATGHCARVLPRESDLSVTERDVIQIVVNALTSAAILAEYVQREIIETPEIAQMNLALIRATTALLSLAPSGRRR
jgi:hypothetical protein